ncbi:CHAT domain-containing protein [Novosphingobium sp. MW5]|nr:CHAT domain-containing protein [Novosphingobium sp. MW5]
MRNLHLALLCAVALPCHSAWAAASEPASPAAPRLSLVEEVRAAKLMDTGGNPKEALAKIDDLLTRAGGNKSIPRIDMIYAEATRAAALFWLRDYDQSLSIYRRLDAELTAGKYPMSSDWGELLNNIGSVLSTVGKLDEAMPYKQRALEISEKLTGRDSIEYAGALYGVALIDFRRGRPLDAIPKVKEAGRIARAVAEKTNDNFDKPGIYGLSLSTLYIQAGDSASAVDAAREAALWSEAKLGESHRVTMAALNQLGASLSDAGLYAQAIPVLRRSLELRTKAYPPGHPDLAYSLHALGFALDNVGLVDNAKPFYEQAAAIFEKSPDRGQPMSLATVTGQLARIAIWDGDQAGALALREKALEIARAKAPAPEHPELLRAEANLAAELITARRFDEAEKLLEHANKGLAERAMPGNILRISALVYAAKAKADRGQETEGFAMASAALQPARSRLLDRATPRPQLARIADQYHPLFVQFAGIAARANRPDAAFEALQLANVSDLQGAFSTLAGLSAASDGEAAEAVRAYQALAVDGTRIRNGLNQAVAAGNRAQMEQFEGQLAEVDGKMRERDAQLTRLIPGYAALTSVQPTSLERAQASLGARRGMVIYGRDESGLFVFAVTAKGTAHARSGISPRRLAELQQAVRGSIEQGLESNGTTPFDRKAGHELYLALFPDPVRKLLAGVDEIDVLANGSLASLPFAALVTEAPRGRDDDPKALRATKWLATRHAVAVPIGLGAEKPANEAQPSARNFAGIGAPSLGPAARLASRSAVRLRNGDTSGDALRELASLPGAERELTAMASYFGGERRLLVGAQATETAVKAMPLDKVNVLAFATHGLVGGRYRDLVEPALVLTPPDKPGSADDGLLTASEVARLRLNADWVILSACDTSAGDGAAGPTYSGLARSFVAAGARTLLLSHWPVRDDVASRLTLSTVSRAAKGGSRAQALRQAQLAILKDASIPGGAHPATWAPFVLLGH